MSKNKVAALMLALFCAILLFIKLVLLDIQLQSGSLFLDLAFLLLLISLTIFNLVRYKDIFLEKTGQKNFFWRCQPCWGWWRPCLLSYP